VQPQSGIWIIFKVYTLITPRVELSSNFRIRPRIYASLAQSMFVRGGADKCPRHTLPRSLWNDSYAWAVITWSEALYGGTETSGRLEWKFISGGNDRIMHSWLNQTRNLAAV